MAAERRAAQCRERVAEAERLKAIDVLELRNRLAAFALHCDHETRGAARLRRLTPRDAVRAMSTGRGGERAARLLRERRALRGGWTSSASSRSRTGACRTRSARGGEEEDAAERREEKAVKGLFCDVPAASVERLVLYGLRGDAAPLERTLFDDAWLADQSRDAGRADGREPRRLRRDGRASRPRSRRRAARDAASLEFPRAFSRYSTLESVRGDARKGGEKAGRLRVLALCRVLVGAVRVEEDASTDGPEPDALYSSVREEYRPLKPENVLPEFLLLYRLAPAKDKTHVDAPALSGGAALALDGVARQAAGLFAEDGPPAAGDDAAFRAAAQSAARARGGADRGAEAAVAAAPRARARRPARGRAAAAGRGGPGGGPLGPRQAQRAPRAAHRRRDREGLSSAGEAAASPRPPSRPADAAWADEPSSPAEKRGERWSPLARAAAAGWAAVAAGAAAMEEEHF